MVTILSTLLFVFIANQAIKDHTKTEKIKELTAQLGQSNASRVESESKLKEIEAENSNYNNLIQEVVNTIASNDKEYGIGGGVMHQHIVTLKS